MRQSLRHEPAVISLRLYHAFQYDRVTLQPLHCRRRPHYRLLHRCRRHLLEETHDLLYDVDASRH